MPALVGVYHFFLLQMSFRGRMKCLVEFYSTLSFHSKLVFQFIVRLFQKCCLLLNGRSPILWGLESRVTKNHFEILSFWTFHTSKLTPFDFKPSLFKILDFVEFQINLYSCLLYTSDAADE